MKSYYYLDYLHREIFLEEEDIQTVPESGRADDACSAIAEKPYVVEQFMADSFRTLKDVASRLCDSPDIKSRHDALMYIVWRVALDIKEWRTLSHSEAAVKVTREDGFVWLLVSAENARKLWEADVFSLYRLYADDSESLIESEAELESTIKGGWSAYPAPHPPRPSDGARNRHSASVPPCSGIPPHSSDVRDTSS